MIIDVTELEFTKLNFIRPYETLRRNRARLIYENGNVQITKVDKIDEGKFIIDAEVEGNSYIKYSVTLTIKDSYIRECECTCEDFENGFVCKHILATSMEVIEPHYPSTKEGREKLLKSQREKEEERKKEYLKKIQEERRIFEYRMKYSNALKTINKFKDSTELQMNDIKLDSNVDLRNLYEDIKLEREINKTSNLKILTQIRIEPRVKIRNNEEINITFKIRTEQNVYIKGYR